MPVAAFDTLKLATRLQEAGLPRKTAAGTAAALQEALGESYTTKSGTIEAVETLGHTIGARFDGVDARLGEHTAVLREHTTVLREHTARLDSIEATQGNHTAVLREHTTVLREHTARLDSIEATQGNHTQTLADITATMNANNIELNNKLNRLLERLIPGE